MANNYNAFTIEPMLPAALLSGLHRALLDELGFTLQPSDDYSNFYLYGAPEESSFELDGHTNDLSGFEKLGTLDDSALSQKVRAIQAGNLDTGISVIDVLADVVDRAPAQLPEVLVLGAYWCSRMRPGEFGGMTIRITPGSIQSTDSAGAVAWFREETQHIADIADVLDLALKEVERRRTEEPDGIDRHLAAWSRLHDYAVNHPSLGTDEDDQRGLVWSVQHPHERFTLDAWRAAVAEGATFAGYARWVLEKLLQEPS